MLSKLFSLENGRDPVLQSVCTRGLSLGALLVPMPPESATDNTARRRRGGEGAGRWGVTANKNSAMSQRSAMTTTPLIVSIQTKL